MTPTDLGLAALLRRVGQDAIILQTLPLSRALSLRPLYWTCTAPAAKCAISDAEGVVLPGGSTFSSDTYFGNFFEYQWRLHTKLASLSLRLDMQGSAIIRIKRRTPHGGETLLVERVETGPVSVAIPCDATHFRQPGRLWFELEADGDVTLAEVSWETRDSPREPVRLGLGICTFNRDRHLAQLLDRIEQHQALDGVIDRVIVVNQGDPKLTDRLSAGPRVDIIDQPNLGGAGGFGRAMLEFLADDQLTHLCLIDDDVSIEPDSLLRMGAFLALARSNVAVGGHMLDSIQPFQLYEAGALVRGNGMLQPLMQGRDLREPGTLDALLDTVAMDFNGWWMFAVSKPAVQKAGLPLPCFIRGDDVEYGVRLAQCGAPTVSVPGVSIWHEPFYLKIGGWQLYYETRNSLTFQALHRDTPPRDVAIVMIKHLLTHLLTYRYYSTALIVRAIEDYVGGPAFLIGDPRPTQALVLALKTGYPDEWTRREHALSPARTAGSPRNRAGFVLRMVHVLLRNAMRPSPPGAQPRGLGVHDLVWFRVFGADCLAVETRWDQRLPTFRRDAARFRQLSWAGVRAIWRLYRTHAAVAAETRSIADHVTSPEFWGDYVAVDARTEARDGDGPDDPTVAAAGWVTPRDPLLRRLIARRGQTAIDG